jgi:molybdenum cofactor cytidylyltransferase
VLKKGRRLAAADIDALAAAGYQSVVAARLAPDDLGEDEAAARIAAVVAGSDLRLDAASTGRCNLHAEAAGLLKLDVERILALNQIDEAVTLATLPEWSPLPASGLAATIKIIPFAVPTDVVERCCTVAAGSLAQLLPFQPERVQVGLLLTRLPSVPESLLDRAAGSQRVRAQRLGGQILVEERCPHEESAVAAALRRLLDRGCSQLWVLGASAIVDRSDVIPAAIQSIGGYLEHFGMPVDPGNLLLLARHGKTPVIGVPGCARSLRRSGFDWVIERLAVGLPVTAATVQAMGVGGLLSEGPLRPQPRTTALAEPKVAAIVLAAGLSRRMGDANKLLQPVGGTPVLLRVLSALRDTALSSIVVVTGHQAAEIESLLTPYREQGWLRCVHNPDYAAGLSTSLRVGIAALSAGGGGATGSQSCDGALICLGDMPRVTSAHIEALLAAFDPSDGRELIVPTYHGQRGNPVLWSSRYFPELQQLAGDSGARSLLERHADVLCYVPMPDDGVTIDVDTPEALKRVQDQG